MRLIDADGFYEQLEEIRMEYLEEDTMSSNFAADVLETVQDCYLKEAPTIDPESLRPKGRWVHDINNLYGCDQCLARETMSPKKMKHFCPNCGARMEG